MISKIAARMNTALFLFPLFQFLIRYRRTALGPIWLLAGPAVFITLLGQLYAHVGMVDVNLFIPHLASGYIIWSLISSFLTQSTSVYQRSRAQIMQGAQSLNDIIIIDVMIGVYSFLHQIPVIIAVFLIYSVPLHWSTLESLLGLAFVIANGFWVMQVFGILGVRYRDLSEVFQATMRIAFLVTPIIWMPGRGMRSGLVGTFLIYNPFYHFLEVVRAPLLGQPVTPLSWVVVIGITIAGFFLARVFGARYARFIPLWV